MSYQQTIYNVLRKHGLTEAAAFGMLGNLWCESNCEPFRLQGDFSSYKTVSKAYVQRATNGQMSKDEFCKAVGFGIAQWTYPQRKANLWSFWKESGKALDSAEMQADFIVHELQTEYQPLLQFLKNTSDIFTATSRICREYERPAVNNIDARFQAANRIKYEIDLNDSTVEPQPTPEPEEDHSLQLRTIDCHCTGFHEIWLLQALLLCRNYPVLVDGIWIKNDTTDIAVEAFQKANNLKPDRCVGKLTWKELGVT